MINKNKKRLRFFIISVISLFLFLFIFNINYNNETIVGIKNDNKTIKNDNKAIKLLTINESKNNYKIIVEYPRFNILNVDKIVTDYIYSYVNNFKKEAKDNKTLNTLSIKYDLFFKDDYVNLFFNINNSISNIKYKNIIIDMKKQEQIHINEIYNEKDLKEDIKIKLNTKYSKEVISSINLNEIDKYTFYFNKKETLVYFDEYKDYKESFIPYVSLNKENNNTLPVLEEKAYDKYVAFTFDDGPSENTLNILNALDSYDYSATFFMLGNRMKYNKEIVKKVSESNSEIASHSYSHKSFINISLKEMFNEFNSTQVIYNEITGKNIKYFRPPYGSYNKLIITSANVPLILWSIDPKDWLTRNENKICEHILNNIYDGSIILLHDVYPSTVEAIKMIFPQLENMGYKVVSVSKLLEIKNKTLSSGQVIREVK